METRESSAGATSSERTSLAALADLSNRLAQTKSRLELMRLVGGFLGGLPLADLPVAVRLLVGQPFPEGDPRKLDVSGATLWRAVCALASSAVSPETLWGEAVDFGQAVERLFQEVARVSGTPGLTLDLEFKLDGARVQVHLDRDEIRLFSRRLHDVTESLPDIAREVRGAVR